MKKFLAFVLVAILAASVAVCCVACTPNSSIYDEDVDPNRTQLYIGNYYGGLGDAWLKELKRQYQELHPDVQILIKNDKAPYLRDALINSITTDTENMYFVDKAYYYDMASENKLADITDIVREPLTKYGETRSIEDKLDEININYYAKNSITNDKYYALPTYVAQRGIVYDVDLFEQKGLYISADSDDQNVMFTKNLKNLSVGPDGKAGTTDDGLPATYDQFVELIDYMKSINITPYIWTGKYSEYQTATAVAWWADYEGYDDFRLNYTFNGTTEIDGEEVTITEENAYLLQKQEGKRYALQFVKDIFSDPYNFTSSSGTTVNDHIGAQKEYVSSFADSKQPIAMLFEGDWWENEARDSGAFSSVAAVHGSEWDYGQRRFAFLPIPKTEGSDSERTVLSCSGDGAFFINANCNEKILAIAKDFLQFCHTDNALQVFNTYTGVCRPYDYTLTDEQYQSLTYFGKSLYDMYKVEKVNVCYNLSESNMRIRERAWFDNWAWDANISEVPYTNPFQAFASNRSVTVDQYFNGLYKQQQSNWSRFSKYFG